MINKFQNKKIKAFTLLELLLSMTLIAFMFVMSVPLYQNFLFRSEIDDAINIYYKSLKSAQNYAQDGLNDSSWGVAFSNSEIVIFAGSTYATRNTDLDKAWNVGSRISASGLTEVVFSKLYGLPNTTGTINLINTGVTKSLTINAKGQITY